MPGKRILIRLGGAVLLAAVSVSAPALAHTDVSVGIGWWPGYVGWWYPDGPYYVPDEAAVDTDIHPEDAEVWLDGAYVGFADQFDGFPRYLRIATGRHRLEFRLEGYRSLVIDFRARPGRLYALDRWLKEGKGPTEPVPAPPRERAWDDDPAPREGEAP